MNKISLRIADLRKKNKITQQTLADHIGVSFQTISKWETGNQVLLVRHTYGGAKGKLLIHGGFCCENELPEVAAAKKVLEETSIIVEVKRMVGIRCDRKTWYLLLEMDYVDGIPTSDMKENSEVLFCDISEALTRNDCTEMTKVALRKILDDTTNYFYSDIEYKKHKGDNYTLYI